MLHHINVKSLFGLYSYKLDMQNPDRFPVKFITGPNGYGKTTLLYLASALYAGDFDSLLDVEFDEIEFKINNDTIRFWKGKKNSAAESIDDYLIEETILHAHVIKDTDGKTLIDDFDVTENSGSDNEKKRNLAMSLRSLPYYYIKDQRLIHNPAKVGSTDVALSLPAVDDNAEDLKEKLGNAAAELNSRLQTLMSGLDFKGDISQSEYERRCLKLNESIVKLQGYGLMPLNFNIYRYDDAPPAFLNAYLNALETVISSESDFVDRLDAFNRIISRYGFADKEMEISPRFGYRFRLQNETKSILSPSVLSSGEQHLLIMTYELLFKAQDNSTVFIDEPEMSFHLMWQSEFLNSLTDIVNARNRKLQCIVATHSPQIFGNRWDLTVDLYSQNNKQIGR